MLRCGSCDDPICPRCMVHGHVGVRCLDCGKAVTLPTYQVTGVYLARAIGAAVATGAAAGLVYALILSRLAYVLDTLILLGIGYLVAEAASRAADRKRGRTMQYVVGGGLAVAMVIILLLSPVLSIWTLIGMVIAFVVGTGRVR